MKKIISILFFISICCGRFFVDIGFALKPYMLISIVMLLYIIAKNEKISFKMDIYEKKYFIFIGVLIFSFIHLQYIEYIFRYILAVILLIIVYFIIKTFFKNEKINCMDQYIKKSGIIIGTINLIIYIYSINVIHYNFIENGIIKYGLLLDRGYPRFIGTFSTDPNISGLYITFFLTYFLTKSEKSKMDIYGLCLYIILLLATLSRGAILSFIIIYIIYLIMDKKENVIIKVRKIVLNLLIITLLFFLLSNILNIKIIEIMTDRVQSDKTGSGRTVLWKYAVTTFLEHPIMGIGINSTLEYNKMAYGTNANHYIHNTYLEVLSELGIIGFFTYAIMLFSITKKTYNMYKKEKKFLFIYFLIFLIQIAFLSVLLNEIFIVFLSLIKIYDQENQLIYGGKNDLYNRREYR